MVRRLLRSDYALNLAGKAHTIIVGVLASAFLTRYLGIELRGEYAFILQCTAMAVLIADFGFSQTYGYFFRKYEGGVLAHFLELYAWQFVVAASLALAVGTVTDSAAVAYVCLLLPFGVLRMRMDSTAAVESLRVSVKLRMLSTSLNALLFGLVLILKPWLGESILYPALVTVFVNLLTVGMYAHKLSALPVGPLQHRVPLRESMSRSALPMLSVILVTMNYSVDIFLLRFLGAPQELSLYSVAAGIMTYIWFIPDAFKEVVASRVARASGIGMVNTAIKLSGTSVMIAIVLFVAVGHPALGVLYGREFTHAYGVTLVLLVGVVSMVFYKVIGVLFLAEGRNRFYFLTLAASVSVNIGANWIFIPKWGMYGAALASVLSYGLCGTAFLVRYLQLTSQSLGAVVLLRWSDVRTLLSREAGRQ